MAETRRSGAGSTGVAEPVGSGRPVASEQMASEQEARWLAEHVASLPTDRRAAALDELVRRRTAGEPLQYVLGRWPFRTVDLRVDRRALIPRPETERVVEEALRELDRLAGDRSGAALPGTGDPAEGPRCADLGTGSGAIALALAVEGGAAHPGLEVWATDRSPDALELAAENLATLAPADAARVRLAEGRWYEALPAALAHRFDLVVSNPPYVAEAELAGLDPEVREWEPVSALVAPTGRSGVGGTADIEVVVAGAPRWLRPGGVLVVEIAPHQAYAVVDLARRAGFSSVDTRRDLAGRLRMLVAVR